MTTSVNEFLAGHFTGLFVEKCGVVGIHLVARLFDGLVDGVGHLDDFLDKPHLQSRGGQLIFLAHGPESVGQVVVLHRAVLLYGVVTAVVVGENQSFGGDDFAGATAAEDDYGVFHRGAVGVVDVVDIDEQTGLFQLFAVLLFEEGQEPHAFIGHGRREGEGCGKEGCQSFS